MIGCIYHEADLDGVMSAAIVKKYFKGDIDLLDEVIIGKDKIIMTLED